MKRIIFVLLVALSAKSFAETSMPAMATQFGLIAQDPAKVVEAWDKYINSDCKVLDYAGGITLTSHLFNGKSPWTHSIGFFYPTYEAWESLVKELSQCKGIQELRLALREHAEPATQVVTKPIYIGGAEGPHPVSMNYEIVLTNEKAYIEAWKQLMESEMEGVSYSAHRIVFGADKTVTHILNIGAPSYGELMEAVDSIQETPAMAQFSKMANQWRSVTSISMGTTVKSWQ